MEYDEACRIMVDLAEVRAELARHEATFADFREDEPDAAATLEAGGTVYGRIVLGWLGY